MLGARTATPLHFFLHPPNPIPTYFLFQPGIPCPLHHLFAIPPSLRIMHSVPSASSVLIFEGSPIKSGTPAVGFGACKFCTFFPFHQLLYTFTFCAERWFSCLIGTRPLFFLCFDDVNHGDSLLLPSYVP
eukprot:RCo001137